MPKRNLLSTLGLILLVTLFLTACGGNAAPEPTATNTPAPTEPPQPTNTPLPTVDVASLPVEDLQATLTALEEELEMAEGAASGAAGEAAESQAESNLRGIEGRIEAVQALIDAASGEGGEDAEAADTEEMAAVTLTLSGNFEEARDWTWEEVEALGTMTETVAGPREDDPEAEYTGVSLTAFLEAAGLAEDAETLVATAADDFAAEIDAAAARECEACLIVLEDGVLRLIMPDFPSNNWVSDVVSLEAQ